MGTEIDLFPLRGSTRASVLSQTFHGYVVGTMSSTNSGRVRDESTLLGLEVATVPVSAEAAADAVPSGTMVV